MCATKQKFTLRASFSFGHRICKSKISGSTKISLKLKGVRLIIMYINMFIWELFEMPSCITLNLRVLITKLKTQPNYDTFRLEVSIVNFFFLVLWSIVSQVIDARNPLLYRCEDLESYISEIGGGKRCMLLLNKSDLLPVGVRKRWADYLASQSIDFVFWSAHLAEKELEDDYSTGLCGLSMQWESW